MSSNPRDDEEERDQKLKSYEKKDYTEQIEFPVELVDRDGVVRRYTYEESLAVYHRRIQSAPWRHGDESLIQAEVDHCSRRISQIKESYKKRRAEGRAAPSSNPRAALGPGFQVLMSYYRKVLERRDLILHDDFMPQVVLLEDSACCRTYHVGFGRGGGGHLFYVYPFGQGEAALGRTPFLEAKSALRSVASGVDVERLLLADEGERAGYILTGTSDLPPGLRDFCSVLSESATLAEFSSLVEPESPGRLGRGLGAPGQAAYEEGIIAVQEERLEDAIAHFVESIEANGYHRESYLLLLALLDGAGRYAEARLYGNLAERNLPEDGLVAYRQGIGAVRHGDFEEAVRYFDLAARLSPTLYQPHFFGAHVLLVRGEPLEEVQRRLAKAVQFAEARPEVEGTLRAVERCIRLRRSLRLGSVVGVGVSLAGLFLFSSFAAIPLLLAGGIGLFAGPFTEALARLLARRCFQEPA